MSLIFNPVEQPQELCLAFQGKDVVLSSDGRLPSFEELKELQEKCPTYGFLAEPEYGFCALGIEADAELPAGFTIQQVRLYNYNRSEDVSLRVLRAKAFLHWRQQLQYCPKCGAKLTTPHPTLTAMQCDGCNAVHFPRIQPCIIVLVNKGDKLLLCRHVQRHQTIYACVAGFMEAGETAEQTVHREVMEETGLTIKNLKYFGSQSWPFPAQLMIAFTAEYESGELHLQEDEIADANWYSINNLPSLPQPGSIAYEMIHAFIRQQEK